MVLPDPEIVPALAAHVTFVLEEPATDAVNVCDPPAVMLGAFGEMVTETLFALWPGADEFVPVPQEHSREIVVTTSKRKAQSAPEYRMVRMAITTEF